MISPSTKCRARGQEKTASIVRSWLPAPFHLAAGLFGIKRRTPLRDKTALFAFDAALKGDEDGRDSKTRLYRKNDRAPMADVARTVADVPDALLRSRRHRHPQRQARGRLGRRLHPGPARDVLHGARVLALRAGEDGAFRVVHGCRPRIHRKARRARHLDGEGPRASSRAAAECVGVVTDMGSRFEAGSVVSTLPPWDLKKLTLPAALRGPWEGLAPAPIVGATLKLDRPVMTERFIGMLNTETHWVFNKNENPRTRRGRADAGTS